MRALALLLFIIYLAMLALVLPQLANAGWELWPSSAHKAVTHKPKPGTITTVPRQHCLHPPPACNTPMPTAEGVLAGDVPTLQPYTP